MSTRRLAYWCCSKMSFAQTFSSKFNQLPRNLFGWSEKVTENWFPRVGFSSLSPWVVYYPKLQLGCICSGYYRAGPIPCVEIILHTSTFVCCFIYLETSIVTTNLHPYLDTQERNNESISCLFGAMFILREMK